MSSEVFPPPCHPQESKKGTFSSIFVFAKLAVSTRIQKPGCRVQHLNLSSETCYIHHDVNHNIQAPFKASAELRTMPDVKGSQQLSFYKLFILHFCNTFFIELEVLSTYARSQNDTETVEPFNFAVCRELMQILSITSAEEQKAWLGYGSG